jgi:hypothetical protein
MLTIKDLAVSKELDTSEMSTARGGSYVSKEPPCTWTDDFGVGEAACAAQATWYQTFGFLLPQ